MARAVLGGRDLLRDVLARYGITRATIHDIRSGRVNKHWRVVTDDGTYALRRYTPRRSVAAIRYEHEVLAHAARLGWPVAAPLPAVEGATAVEVGERRYALFPFLPGRPAPYGNARYLRIKGGMLARLHRDLSSWPAPGQREGFGALWDLDAYVRQSGFESFAALVEAFGREHPALAWATLAQHDATRDELAAADVRAAPDGLVHFDFHHDNILFVGGQLSALLDFDLVHWDLRVSDIATSLRLDCLRPPDYNELDPDAVRAWLGGYLAETRLTDAELRLILPLVRASILSLVTFRLLQWADGSNPKALRSIERSLSARFPRLDRQEGAVMGAIAAAVEGDKGGQALDRRG